MGRTDGAAGWRRCRGGGGGEGRSDGEGDANIFTLQPGKRSRRERGGERHLKELEWRYAGEAGCLVQVTCRNGAPALGNPITATGGTEQRAGGIAETEETFE